MGGCTTAMTPGNQDGSRTLRRQDEISEAAGCGDSSLFFSWGGWWLVGFTVYTKLLQGRYKYPRSDKDPGSGLQSNLVIILCLEAYLSRYLSTPYLYQHKIMVVGKCRFGNRAGILVDSGKLRSSRSCTITRVCMRREPWQHEGKLDLTPRSRMAGKSCWRNGNTWQRGCGLVV